MSNRYSIGLDFGTNSVRALVVDVATGAELATSVSEYPSGAKGVLLDPADPNLARQRPQDHLHGLERSVRGAITASLKHDGFDSAQVIGMGVDTTGSTPIPLDENGRPLALQARFESNPHAQAWLWKDHTGHAEAAEITALARKMRPEYLAKCGGTYSSEWFWSKILRCLRVAPDVFEAAYTWVEHADWMPAVLTGTVDPHRLKRSICAAGHKAMFHDSWGGYPDEEFVGALEERLVRVRQTLPTRAHHAAQSAGELTAAWAERLGLRTGIPVAVGAFDAHLGAIGSGIETGTLVKIIGTSTCDLMIAPLDQDVPDIPGLCGIVPESVIPGYYGLEAGQSAVGDIFNWFVDVVKPGHHDHASLTSDAERLMPGESGLLALDWHNGNRTILVDPRLTGLILGLTLYSTPAEIYRALVESTAFGARTIVERYEEYGIPVERIVNCGGISAKNRLVMQIYADVIGRPQYVSRSTQTPALGAAMAGAVVAGSGSGGHPDFQSASRAMTGVDDTVFEPIPANRRIYDRLYALYRRLHDAFGVEGVRDDLHYVMKQLMDLRDEARRQ
jgi:L-ribulokinase